MDVALRASLEDVRMVPGARTGNRLPRTKLRAGSAANQNQIFPAPGLKSGRLGRGPACPPEKAGFFRSLIDSWSPVRGCDSTGPQPRRQPASSVLPPVLLRDPRLSSASSSSGDDLERACDRYREKCGLPGMPAIQPSRPGNLRRRPERRSSQSVMTSAKRFLELLVEQQGGNDDADVPTPARRPLHDTRAEQCPTRGMRSGRLVESERGRHAGPALLAGQRCDGSAMTLIKPFPNT
jgi:hypothetical protein